MKDIQVDENGDLRCASCGGRHFHDRRTTRAHIVGWTTVGIGALATRKKLRCKLCGAYNKQGNAQPFNPATPGQSAAPTYAVEAGSYLDRHQDGMSMKERKRREKATPSPSSSSREGQFLTVKKPGPKF